MKVKMNNLKKLENYRTETRHEYSLLGHRRCYDAESLVLLQAQLTADPDGFDRRNLDSCLLHKPSDSELKANSRSEDEWETCIITIFEQLQTHYQLHPSAGLMVREGANH